ncbi:MAG TPA: hypothetical protein VK943_09910 [Arenibaculum sp.]|nr:hypothetical protein [Arenibaculum sp.]
MKRIGPAIAVAAALMALAAPAISMAQPAKDPDWPCIQVLVPNLSPGQIWAGPPIEPPPPWRDDPLAARAARDLARTTEPPDDRLDQLAAEAGQQRDRILTLTFAGVFETLDAERTDAIASIKRYARQQRALSQRIADILMEMEALPAGDPRRDTLAADLAISRRILDDRRRSISAVCDQPIRIEQRLGTIARAIAARMDE